MGKYEDDYMKAKAASEGYMMVTDVFFYDEYQGFYKSTNYDLHRETEGFIIEWSEPIKHDLMRKALFHIRKERVGLIYDDEKYDTFEKVLIAIENYICDLEEYGKYCLDGWPYEFDEYDECLFGVSFQIFIPIHYNLIMRHEKFGHPIISDEWTGGGGSFGFHRGLLYLPIEAEVYFNKKIRSEYVSYKNAEVFVGTYFQKGYKYPSIDLRYKDEDND